MKFSIPRVTLPILCLALGGCGGCSSSSHDEVTYTARPGAPEQPEAPGAPATSAPAAAEGANPAAGGQASNGTQPANWQDSVQVAASPAGDVFVCQVTVLQGPINAPKTVQTWTKTIAVRPVATGAALHVLPNVGPFEKLYDVSCDIQSVTAGWLQAVHISRLRGLVGVRKWMYGIAQKPGDTGQYLVLDDGRPVARLQAHNDKELFAALDAWFDKELVRRFSLYIRGVPQLDYTPQP